ncbi:hypothetical protein LEP1GSC047_3604 [Leptospira inadai serovar Lyme str. 10]|uniref:Uncharacterized protein n=1 Tax=Leptospira inadai serovar Lyme str. 10 TaxID=1049790 RepID=V6HKN8_9LEPT|nr:hypothetical protein LEP1GSC047_3604 [Leptospira inadai serovar Lyme str. 10]
MRSFRLAVSNKAGESLIFFEKLPSQTILVSLSAKDNITTR